MGEEGRRPQGPAEEKGEGEREEEEGGKGEGEEEEKEGGEERGEEEREEERVVVPLGSSRSYHS